MVIDNLDIRWTGSAFRPFKANSPLIVDPDAILALSISLQRLKTVARQNSQISELNGGLQTIQVQPRSPYDTRECLDMLAGREIRGALVPIADDHKSE